MIENVSRDSTDAAGPPIHLPRNPACLPESFSIANVVAITSQPDLKLRALQGLVNLPNRGSLQFTSFSHLVVVCQDMLPPDLLGDICCSPVRIPLTD